MTASAEERLTAIEKRLSVLEHRLDALCGADRATGPRTPSDPGAEATSQG